MSEPGLIRRHLGLDWFDLLLHAGLTGCTIGFIAMTDGPEALFPVIVGASLALLGLRRHTALKRRGLAGVTSGEMAAVRLEDMEQRLAELEATQARVAELEERLDFAERMLAREPSDRRVLEDGSSRGASAPTWGSRVER
jgi:hypothetical protein